MSSSPAECKKPYAVPALGFKEVIDSISYVDKE